ncbi:MAG TPA: hypothetical protein VFE13_01760 [Caulobacteraceae bacterium]|nr:hypothetical protein [Caulobacteraceae bacterium]
MDVVKDQRVIVLGGGGLALAAGLAAAWLLLGHKPAGSPPAPQGGLTVVSGRDDDAKLDPKRPLRCFVGGQFVGELPLAVCAQRNGVATGALDVGLDQAGALAASNGVNSTLTPLPAQQAQPSDRTAPSDGDEDSAAATATGGGAQACWRFGGAGWRELPAPMPLQACIGALYAGRCPISGDAFYGRWGDQSLRLVNGRVEISQNNRDFSPIVDPWPACRLDPG